jgi:pimeloyl-ACP methyl ester carboxylesterase
MSKTSRYRSDAVRAFAIALLASMTGLASAAADEPFAVARQGSIEAGGKVIDCRTNDGGNRNNPRQPPGKVVVDNVYATFQYPANLRHPHPILFNPGGGHTARVYDTTPDGREGWLTLFVREGFAVYGVDRVNTGRSGTDICRINAVKLGDYPAKDLPALNRYAAESAWVTFRWGPAYGTFYDNTQFPKEAAEQYYPQLTSTYRDPDETPKAVAALVALIDKVGPVILQSWSSSATIIYKAAIARPDKVKAILALEHSPGAFDEINAEELKILAKIPILNVIGDNTPERVAGARKFEQRMQAASGLFTVDVLPEAGIFGNGHTMMLEKNNKQIMHRMIAWLEGNVYRPQ